MEEKPPVIRPLWVRVTLWGLTSRGSALAYMWLCVGFASVCVVLGFWNRLISLGAIALLGALGYLRAVRWVDKHGGWS
jgi:hypothetical protein